MPLLKISSNKAVDKEKQEAFLKDASLLLVDSLGKNEKYVMTIFNPEVAMTFAGDHNYTAYLEIKSIRLTPGQASELSEKICRLVEGHLAISPSRVYIEFCNAERSMWGWNGTTF